MSESPQEPRLRTPDDALPPVEPPSAGFIVQLFVIPAVIVGVLIVGWLTIEWLRTSGNDPRNYVAALKRNNANRWQEAVNLANELQKTGNESLKNDATLARELGELLSSEIDAGSFDDKDVTLRVYLCRVLGEFHVPEVLPALEKALQTERDERERDVRLAAMQGLARLIPNLSATTLRNAPQLGEALIAASQDANNVVRYHAAYTLGVLGGEASAARLKVLLDDADVDVRMNAATGLARHGDAAATDELAAMLGPDAVQAAATEEEEPARLAKEITVRLNALEAIAQLATANPTADRKPLIAAVDELIAGNPQADVRAKAEDVKRTLAR